MALQNDFRISRLPGETLADAMRRIDRALRSQRAPTQSQRRLVIDEPRYLLLDEGAKLLRFDVTAPADPRGAFRKYLKAEVCRCCDAGASGSWSVVCWKRRYDLNTDTDKSPDGGSQ